VERQREEGAEVSQELYATFITLFYTFSSVVGAVLFTIIWRMVRGDRIELESILPELLENRERERAIARRNELVAGVLAFSFILYSGVGVLASIRNLELFDLPWVPGAATITLLVIGNFLEMLIAIVLIRTRRFVNSVGRTDEEDGGG
jgi:hypothetical protein